MNEMITNIIESKLIQDLQVRDYVSIIALVFSVISIIFAYHSFSMAKPNIGIHFSSTYSIFGKTEQGDTYCLIDVEFVNKSIYPIPFRYVDLKRLSHPILNFGYKKWSIGKMLKIPLNIFYITEMADLTYVFYPPEISHSRYKKIKRTLDYKDFKLQPLSYVNGVLCFKLDSKFKVGKRKFIKFKLCLTTARKTFKKTVSIPVSKLELNGKEIMPDILFLNSPE